MSFDQVKQEAKKIILEVMHSPAFGNEEISEKGRWAYVRASNALSSSELIDLYQALDGLLNCPDIVGDFVDPTTQEVALKAEEMRSHVWQCLLN